MSAPEDIQVTTADVSEDVSAPNRCVVILKTIVKYRGLIVTFLIPLALLPLIFYVKTTEAKAAFIVITMSFYWNFEVVPLGVTALIPVVLVPVLGIMPSRDICPTYFKDSNMLFLGGLILAVSIEIWNLHKRIALRVLLLCGVQPRWLLFGFLVPTWILSMWISNTATVAMMLPIAEAVLAELRKHYQSRPRLRHGSRGRRPSRSEEAAPTETEGVSNPAFEMSATSSSKLNGDAASAISRDAISLHLEPTEGDSTIGNGEANRGSMNGGSICISSTRNHGNSACESSSSSAEEEEEIDEAHDVDTRMTMQEFVNDKRNAEFASIARMLMLSVSYGAVFGGVATLTGTAPNVILNGIVQEYFGSETPLNYSSWMFFGLPLAVVTLLIAWVWLQISFLGFRGLIRPKKLPKRDENRIKATLKQQYEKLGPITYAEVTVVLLFTLTVGLWISREPGVRGWSALFLGPDPKSSSGSIMSYTSDAQPSVLSAILLFFLPSQNPFTCCRSRCSAKSQRRGRSRSRSNSTVVAETEELTLTVDQRPTRMMTWKLMQERVAWNIVLMLGAGFALAETSKASGLSDWIGRQFLHLQVVPLEALIFIFCLFSAMLTEWTSNGTAATILLPILASFSQNVRIHPFYFMLSCTASFSFAFTLPISTPANILVYARGYLRAVDMLRTGCVMWLISNSIVAVATITYAPAIFGLRVFPDWAMKNITAAAA